MPLTSSSFVLGYMAVFVICEMTDPLTSLEKQLMEYIIPDDAC